MTDQETKDLRKEFNEAVNMTPHQLREWLDTDESRSVGQGGDDTKSGPGGKESTGHRSGRHIVSILEKKQGDLTDGDYAHMRKVLGYISRHRAQKPAHPEDSRWRHSLMNWGHDPLKK